MTALRILVSAAILLTAQSSGALASSFLDSFLRPGENLSWQGWDEYRTRERPPEQGFRLRGFALGGVSVDLDGSGSTWVLGTQKNLNYRFPAANGTIGIGAYITGYADSFGSNGDVQPYAFYKTGDTRITLGFTQDAWSKLVPEVQQGHDFWTIAKNVNQIRGRIDTKFGDTRASLSYSESQTLSVALSRKIGDWRVFGALNTDVGGGGNTDFTVGGRVRIFDRLKLSGAFTQSGATSEVGVSGRYIVNDFLKIAGSVQVDDSSNVTTVLGAKVGLARNTYGYVDLRAFDGPLVVNPGRQIQFGAKVRF